MAATKVVVVHVVVPALVQVLALVLVPCVDARAQMQALARAQALWFVHWCR